jgi:hypothetical protein
MAHIEKALPVPLGESVSFTHLKTALGSQPGASSGANSPPSPAQTTVSEKK